MFCFQCQEAAKNTGCSVKGVCGKTGETAGLQDLLIHVLKGISIWGTMSEAKGGRAGKPGRFIARALFATITNVNFDNDRLLELIREGLQLREELKARYAGSGAEDLHDSAVWFSDEVADFETKAAQVGVLATGNEDVRSLQQLLIYGLKGIAAYADHAAILGFEDDEIYGFLMEGLVSTTKVLSVEEMVAMVMRAGECAVKTMALLDRANTAAYGNPEISKISIGVGPNPGILISGHDLRDLQELLEQTAGTGVDVYTHGEMLPANAYPAFRRYDHFVGNYGNAWWQQAEEFASFNGPILMTTNCIVPVAEVYKDRIFTTGMAGYPGVRHIPDRADGGSKDFSELVALARQCAPPVAIETGEIVAGFAHNQVLALADKVVAAVKSGAIRRFVVMAGCDGRHKSREYYTQLARELPADTLILTAGCAKYRYNKLDLGEIDGIPRLLDAGQCNDCYSLVVIAQRLQEAFGLDDINDLPISYDIAWYEQKAVTVLLALLFLGVRGIRLGPTLPAFLSPDVVKVLVERFDIRPIGEVITDIEALLQGR